MNLSSRFGLGKEQPLTREELTRLYRKQQTTINNLEQRIAALEPKAAVPDPNQLSLQVPADKSDPNVCSCVAPQYGLGTRHCLACFKVHANRVKE